MKFNYENISKVPEKNINKAFKKLSKYREHLKEASENPDYPSDEGSLYCPFDKRILSQVLTAIENKKTTTLQYVVIVGIGGSNLGTAAVYKALTGSLGHLVDRLPKLIFLDTVAEEKMTVVTKVLNNLQSQDDFIIISISKSGGTTETIANTEILQNSLLEHFGSVRERMVVISSEGSRMWEVSKSQGIELVSIPSTVGGRYSVLTAVGLLPLVLARFDVEELLKGARQAVEDGLADNPDTNHSLTSAALNFYHSKKKRNIHSSFFFSTELRTLGMWYRQLMGESIGKKLNLDGNEVRNGITPVVSIGSTDLHSMGQLYFGGPNDKFTNIITVTRGGYHKVPYNALLPGLVKNIEGKTLNEIMEAVAKGTIETYRKLELPFVHIELENMIEYEIGYYLQFRMMEMMYLAKLMNVNAFDQPQVELYKEETRKVLENGV